MNDRKTIDLAFETGNDYLKSISKAKRKNKGQFLTPPSVGRLMASTLNCEKGVVTVLDPAIGSGVLSIALIEDLLNNDNVDRIELTGFDTDANLLNLAETHLNQLKTEVQNRGKSLDFELHNIDFLIAASSILRIHLFPEFSFDNSDFDLIICNPPYFKIKSNDPRLSLLNGTYSGLSNIYTIFLNLSADLLSDDGELCFIVPRSFCSGSYFASFRKTLIDKLFPYFVHSFISRDKTFDDVLQENIIISLRKTKHRLDNDNSIEISFSENGAIDNLRLSRQIRFDSFIENRNGDIYFRLPYDEYDDYIIELFDDRFRCSLDMLGVKVSTGKVVPFRSKTFLRDDKDVNNINIFPLLWLSHVQNFKIVWPLDGYKKPQAIEDDKFSELVLPKSNYVLLRRFSTKDEKNRIIASPLLAKEFNYERIGIENHLNVIYRPNEDMKEEFALGLAALLTSSLYDRYIRLVNGSTQINATELRKLPIPDENTINEIGTICMNLENITEKNLGEIVRKALGNSQYIQKNKLTLERDTRTNMDTTIKISQAQQILVDVGMRRQQQNQISALTLLALAQISENDNWSDVNNISLGVHQIMGEINNRYGIEYAENTRETIRKHVIRQFVQSGLAIRNPDEPGLPTNSPRTHYRLTDEFVDLIKNFGMETWGESLEYFIKTRSSLVDKYQKQLDLERVPLTLPSGESFTLSPGSHNELQSAIVENFGEIFVPGGIVLYLGDTEDKHLIYESDFLFELGLPITIHDKLPDVVIFDKENQLLYLIEAVTSSGPVSMSRYIELEEMLTDCKAERVYVTAFQDYKEFTKYISEIAWETDVWLSEIPEHLIHFNGDNFFSIHS